MSGSDGGLAGMSSEGLRAAVRAVLREVLPTVAAGADPGASGLHGTIEQVILRDDADLDTFVRRLAALCDDPPQHAALRDGRTRFRLAPAGPSMADVGPADAVLRVDRGAVTERRVKEAADQGARLVLGRRAVLTPLARDKARLLGVVVEKEA